MRFEGSLIGNKAAKSEGKNAYNRPFSIYKNSYLALRLGGMNKRIHIEIGGRINRFFCFIPSSLGAKLEFLYIKNGLFRYILKFKTYILNIFFRNGNCKHVIYTLGNNYGKILLSTLLLLTFFYFFSHKRKAGRK